MKICFTIMLFLFISNVIGQQSNEKFIYRVKDIVRLQVDKPHQHKFYHYLADCSNEADVILTTFFIGYKNMFSNQDSRSCTFEPSCSVYAIETIKENGFFIGFFDSVDRLTRCNGLSPENYDINIDKHLLIDHP
ncbi:MAG: membrane protein insertion efficiency factor YidD [Bacteroidetes bacterium HGW-Bacteroidetes-1]|nr:MAG: membrane protein insertion efficiency factor YidD [Bacteroidetes bacterium HGW-Bacteroidetes-1]